MNVGTWGAYYSSSSYAAGNINAAHLAFGSGEVHPLNTANRANALSVRCVQHLHGPLSFLRRGPGDRLPHARHGGGPENYGRIFGRENKLMYFCRIRDAACRGDARGPRRSDGCK
ncbi:MAG: hypothetical protein HDT51_00215 [Alistipes sp.]|nr:hypothetical protein [Alistipes sp.]